jgi:hypothetical protein
VAAGQLNCIALMNFSFYTTLIDVWAELPIWDAVDILLLTNRERSGKKFGVFP